LEESVLDDPGLEVVLPEKAELTELVPAMVYPQAIKELWDSAEVTLRAMRAFFAGGKTMKLSRGGYEESLAVPRVPAPAVDAAVTAAVRNGKIWLTSGPASFLAEDVPAGLLTDDAILQAPPSPIPPVDLLPQRTPEAWTDGATTGQVLVAVLSKHIGKVLPWTTVRDAIEGALRARMIERTPDSGAWPCDYSGSANLRLRLTPATPEKPTPPQPPEPPPKPGTRSGEARLQPSQVQDLADIMGDLLKARGSCEMAFTVRVELSGKEAPNDQVVQAVNQVLEKVNDTFRVA
jgi:hypothetical protein